MPRIPFTDLASSPEFKALPPEDQQVVATGYWDEVAAERPDQVKFFNGMRDASKSLLDTKAKRNEAPPVQRRFLDAQVQDLAFDLSLGDELAQGRLTQEGYTEALKVRETESAQRQTQLDKTRDLFSDDPKKQKALALRLEGLEQTAITGGVFGSKPFTSRAWDSLTMQSNEGMVSSSKDAYAALKEQTAKDYGLEPDEVEDLVKHRLGFQDKPVSMDATGNPFIKPDVLAQGPDAVKDAILKSELPWSEKQRMTEKDDLAERMNGYYKSTVQGVQKNHPELYAILDLNQVQDDPKAGFSLIQAALNKGGLEKFAGGITADFLGTAEQIAPMVVSDPVLNRGPRVLPTVEGSESPDLVAERRKEVEDTIGVTRRAQESINQLSQEFYKNQGTLWGVDASAYGSGAGSVLTAVGAGLLTGGASIPVSSARVATMGPTALRMLNGANSVMKASPSVGLAMAKTGTSTYEQAIKAGLSEEEAGKLATLGAATEGVFAGLMSFFGVGGAEAVGEQLFGGAARQAVRDSSKSMLRTFGEKMALGGTFEQFEEEVIAAFDSATVQARINPNMTVEDFLNTMRETALVTLAVSGPTVGAGALRETLNSKETFQQTTDELELRTTLDLASATQPGEADIPPAGQGTPDTAPDGREPAPGAPGVVAPGGTEAVAGTEPGAAETVPGVQAGVAAEPVLVRDDAGVNRELVARGIVPPSPTLSPEARQDYLRENAPDLVDVQETPVGERQTGLPVTDELQTASELELAAAAVIYDLKSSDVGEALGIDQIEMQLDLAERNAAKGREIDWSRDSMWLPNLPTSSVPLVKRLLGSAEGRAALRKVIEAQLPPVQGQTETSQPVGAEPITPVQDKTDEEQDKEASGLPPVEGQPVEQTTAVQAEKGAAQRESEGPQKVSSGLQQVVDAASETGVSLRVGEDPSGITISGIETTKGERRRGRATEAIQAVNREADTKGLPVTLTVEPNAEMSKAALVNWYAKQGYELQEDGQTMVRQPVTPAAETPAVEEAPAETFREPEPTNWSEVFEALNDRDPETKQVDTESPKFKELVAELKNNRVAEAAGKLEQRKADIAQMRAESKAAREAREKEFRKEQKAIKERRKAKQAEKPLDRQRRRILELTKDPVTGKSVSPDYEAGLLEWLRARGYTGGLVKNDLKTMMGEKGARGGPKGDALRQMYFAQTPEVQEVLQSYLNMSQKGKEQHPELQAFENTPIGSAILQEKLKSRSWFRRNKVKPPPAYEKLEKHGRIRAHLASSIFNDNGVLPEDIASGFESESYYGGKSLTVSEEDVVQAIIDLDNGMIATEEDADAQAEKDFQEFERQQQEQEDREIAFAEQQLKALEGDAQTVDLREVRDGDKFALGGTEYTATGVEADKRGQTQSFTLQGNGPLKGTEVTEDFFAESVTPTEGSLAHVDPAEIEAINIAQETPEDFEDETEPAATEPAVQPEAAPEPAAPAPAPEPAAPAPAPQPQTTTPPPPAEPTPAPVSELEDPDEVGMQNAATDRRRQRAGLPPRFAPARLTNQAAWDEAMRRINKDPAAGRDLVNELRKSPRSLDPVETALYTHELLVRTQRTDDAYAAYNKDQNDQTEKDMREAAAAEAEAILTAERIGTIEGRALQARKILVHQDFSLGRLVAKATAANGGKEPNADQMKEIAELHKKLQDVQTELAAAQEQIAKEEAQRVHVTVVADYKKGLRETKKRGEKGPGFIDRQAEAALARIKARKQEGRLNSLPLDELLDHAIVGVRYLKNGLVSIGEFTTQLVKDFGRKVLPFANDIFTKSQELYGAAAPSSKVKSREDVLEDIDPKAPLNDKAIFQLVRHYINEGVDGFEPVMQAVLTDLREFYPDLTLREVHDAYSKYGQTSVPSKEEDLKLAREYRELSRLQSQLEDAQRGLAPLKTGLQREQATQQVRDLTKAVKDTMRKLNIRPTTADGQLRSSFDAIKTRLRNEYEDLDTAIRKGEARKERSPQTFTPAEEAELKALRQRRDDRKADYEAIFKKKGLTDEQRIDRAERLLDRRIAEERDMLEKGILKRTREMLMGPFTPALKSRRETLDKLKAERRELQKAARPKTPELEQKYKRDLASLERRIKEEEKLLAEGLTARQKDIKMGKWTPEMAEMQARLDGLRDARRELAESRKPEKDEAAAAYERATKAIEASIKRYQDILAGVAKTDPGKKFTVDAEMAALLDQRDALRDAAAAMRAMDPARIDKKKQAVLKALDKSINEITRKIQDGDLSTKGRTDFFANDPDVAKIRAARDSLNKTLAAMRKDALPKRSPEEIRNSRDQKLIENKIAKLRDRLARGDYAPKPKLPPPNYAGRDALIKEKKRLESEFNMKVLELALANRSLGRKVFDNTLDVVFGVSRAMLTSFDAGAFGRQAGLVNFMRPGLAIKNFPANFAFTEKAATRYETAMESDPRWARAQAAGLALTSWRPGSSLTDMEEVYRSRIAKKIPGVAASERAYVTYLNQVRFTYFNALMDTLPVAHQTEDNMKFLSRHVNMMTGRGKMGPKMEGAAAALASVFFSPKYWWSRLQVLGNLVYIPLDAMTGFRLGAKETRIARQIVAVEYVRLGAMLGLIFSTFAFAKDAFDWDDEEFTIGTDRRSSDFGKLRIGNTRIDFMAGLLQNVVFISRIATGEKVTAAGEVAAMSGPDAKFKETRLGETVRMLRTKLSPAAGSIANALDGADAVGNKFTWETEILGSYIPMSAAETYSSMRELGVAPGAAAGLLGFIGIGASTYGGEEDYVIEQDILTGRVLEPFGIKPGTFFIDQSRYDKEVKEKGWKIPKPKPLPTF